MLASLALCLALLPLATRASILRYRLYDLDRIISRTVAYGLLTLVLGLGYAGAVLLLGQLFGGLGDRPPNWAVAGATLAVAALFQPARRRLQAVVDRRFNRRRYDAARTVEAFAARRRDQVDLDALRTELLGVVAQTVQPTRASLWLRTRSGSAGEQSWPGPTRMSAMRRTLRGPAALLVLAVAAAACSGGDPDPQAAPTTSVSSTTLLPSTTEAPSTTAQAASSAQFRAAKVRLARVAQLDQPVAMAIRPGERTLYVVEQVGRVRAIRGGRLDPTPVLDISDQVTAGGEQGLLGLAFSPDGRYLYLHYTDRSGDHQVSELTMRGQRADPGSERSVLQIDDPFGNHNGGQLAFGPDRRLYLAFGDGGGGGDPEGNGQSLGSLLGKILRIDPRPGGGRPYRVPSDNPFVDREGARPEIWAYGLRNPWRFSFDAATGDLWIGDVGQNAYEEIDYEPAGSGGRNYGWNRREGRHAYNGGERPSGAVDPVIEYGRAGGACTVIGGFVYRGRRIGGLRGAYLYGDYCAGWVRAARVRDGKVAEQRDLGLSVPGLSSFGVDASGELYALSLGGEVYRLAAA